MKPVPEYATLRDGVFFFFFSEPEVKCDCSSTALVTSAGLIFIDPIPLAKDSLQELVAESFSAPAAVLLTSGNHQRESLVFGKMFGIPVFASADAGDDLVADQRFASGEIVAGMESFPLPGFGPGETAFLYEGTLVFGDALVNLEPHSEEDGLRLLPEKYREDKREALRSLAALQNLSPDIILFAHGDPIVQHASERLITCLDEAG